MDKKYLLRVFFIRGGCGQIEKQNVTVHEKLITPFGG